MSNLSKNNIEELTPANESYKTMKITWENMEKICRDYTDKIDIETNIKKIIELETEYLEKLNEIYNLIEKDNLSIMDKILRKHIPTIILVINATLACLGLSKFETDNDARARTIMSGAGLIGTGAGIILKVKNSSAVNFKQNSLDAIERLKEELKKDIAVNQKFLSIGIRTKNQTLQCKVNIDKDGKIDIFRKYE